MVWMGAWADGRVANSYIVALKSDSAAKHMEWINTQVATYNTSWVSSEFTQSATHGMSPILLSTLYLTEDKGFTAYSVVLDPQDSAVSMDDGSVLKNKNGSPISILEAARAR